MAVGEVAVQGCEAAVQGLLLGLEDADVSIPASSLDISSRQVHYRPQVGDMFLTAALP